MITQASLAVLMERFFTQQLPPQAAAFVRGELV